jgi:hypothetical protein
MTNFNFNGPVNITGNHAHVGDNHYYESPEAFYKGTPNVQYTKTEKELVELIYANKSSEEEREQILNSLRTIKENEGSEGHEESNKQNAERIKHFLESLAAATGAKLIVELGALWLKS